MRAFERVRADTLRYLDTLGEDDLDKPCRRVEGAGPDFQTIGECLSALSLHLSFHSGQVADARRAAGRQPLFV